MKKIWKIRKNSEAVSPVIATILMVAITVVLAAVLYVMVMGFGGTGSSPTGAVTAAKVGTTANYRVTLISITQSTVLPTDITVIVTGSGTCDNVWTHASTYLGAGDSFLVNGTSPGQVSLTLRHVPSSNALATLTFTAT